MTGLTLQHQQQQVIQYQRAQVKKLQIEQEIQALCDQNGGVPPDSSPLQGLLGNQLRPQPPLDFLGMSENRAPQSQNTGSRKSPTEAELAAFRYQIQNPQPSQQAQFMQPPYQPAGGSVFRQHMPPSLVPQRINTAERNGVGGVYGRHPHISPSSSSSGFGTPSFGGGSGSYKASPASFSGHLPSPLASGNALHLPQHQIPASPLSNFSGAVYQVGRLVKLTCLCHECLF